MRINYDPKTKTDKIVYELIWSDLCRSGEAEFTPNLEHDYFVTKAVSINLFRIISFHKIGQIHFV